MAVIQDPTVCQGPVRPVWIYFSRVTGGLHYPLPDTGANKQALQHNTRTQKEDTSNILNWNIYTQTEHCLSLNCTTYWESLAVCYLEHAEAFNSIQFYLCTPKQ